MDTRTTEMKAFEDIYQAAKKKDAEELKKIISEDKSIIDVMIPVEVTLVGKQRLVAFTPAGKLALESKEHKENKEVVDFLIHHGARKHTIIIGYMIADNAEEITSLIMPDRTQTYPSLIFASALVKNIEFIDAVGAGMPQNPEYYSSLPSRGKAIDLLNAVVCGYAHHEYMEGIEKYIALGEQVLSIASTVAFSAARGLQNSGQFPRFEAAWLYLLTSIKDAALEKIVANDNDTLSKSRYIKKIMGQYNINFAQALTWSQLEIRVWLLQASNQSRISKDFILSVVPFMALINITDSEITDLINKIKPEYPRLRLFDEHSKEKQTKSCDQVAESDENNNTNSITSMMN